MTEKDDERLTSENRSLPAAMPLNTTCSKGAAPRMGARLQWKEGRATTPHAWLSFFSLGNSTHSPVETPSRAPLSSLCKWVAKWVVLQMCSSLPPGRLGAERRSRG